jgi:hypothetical protein
MLRESVVEGVQKVARVLLYRGIFVRFSKRVLVLFHIIGLVVTTPLHFQETLAQVPLIIRAVHHLIGVEDVLLGISRDGFLTILIGERGISIPQGDKLFFMLDVQVPLVVLRVLRLISSSIAIGLIDFFSLDTLSAFLLLPERIEEGKDDRNVRKEEPEDQYDRLVDGTKQRIV